MWHSYDLFNKVYFPWRGNNILKEEENLQGSALLQLGPGNKNEFLVCQCLPALIAGSYNQLL